MRVDKPYLEVRNTVGAAYREHAEQWRQCGECPLHQKRSSVVLYRGKLPAPILFLGEAPGHDEDFVGYPFVGPAGELLQDAIESVREDIGEFRYAVANIIACLPRGGDGIREPTPVEAYACSPRLTDFYKNIAKPKLIFMMGGIAQKHITDALPSKAERQRRKHSYSSLWQPPVMVSLQHPSAILRQPELKAGKSLHRFTITVKEAIAQYVRRPNDG